MDLVFTKGVGKFDRLEVVRPGMQPEVIECPKQGIIPHDMVHFAVEHTLLARGCSMLPVDEAAILAVRGQMAELTQRWQALAVGQALTLTL